MQHDQLIWESIVKTCAFKRKLRKETKHCFCRNEYNVTGLCNRSSCPLANSKYATIREEKARCYLYIKSIERAHSPRKLWTKIKLSRNYQKALKQVTEELEYWPELLVHKNKQRLTKIFQYLLRMKKLSALPRPKLIPLQRKVEKVDRKREARAEAVARIDNAIEDELLKRLQMGTYGQIYNFPLEQYNEALEREVKKAREVDLETDEFEEAYESEEEQEVEYVEEVDFEESGDDIEDMEPLILTNSRAPPQDGEDNDDEGEGEGEGDEELEIPKKQKKPRKKRRIELEMEEEFTSTSLQAP